MRTHRKARRLRSAARGAALLLAACWVSSPAEATDYLVRPGKESKVVFVSKASMEKFEGKTDRLEGRLSLDPRALGDSVTFRFEVDLASLDTGIKMRNQHMRENHLETAKYPKAVFEGGRLVAGANGRLEPGTTDSLAIEGLFTLHGVSRRVRIPVVATLGRDPAGERIEFRAEFPVALADYDISRPQFLFLKLADVQQVRVSGVARPATP